jgi:hypothetical protein
VDGRDNPVMTVLCLVRFLIVGVKDPAHPGAQLTDTITLQDWKLAYNSIEFFRFANGATLDLSGGLASLWPYVVPFGETLSGSSVVEKSAIGTWSERSRDPASSARP